MIQKHFFRYMVLLVGVLSNRTETFMQVQRTHEYLLPIERVSDTCYQLNALGEFGFLSHGFNQDGVRTNVLQIWNADQNALKMLEESEPNSSIGQLYTRLVAPNANLDDGIRGHFDVCGDLEFKYAAGIGFQYQLPCNFSIGASLPFYGMSLCNVQWTEKTKTFIEMGDELVRTNLTNNFFDNVKTLGDLNLTGWKRSGVGDLVVMSKWMQHFQQERPLLRDVRLDARLGLTFPTGKRVDEREIFSVPFGNDGSTGIIFGGGLLATLGCYFQAGIDVELLHLFGNTRVRRIKTHIDQTELLLLNKVKAFKDFGITQRFNLNARLNHIFGGLSVGATYQFLKHGDDLLFICCDQFSNTVANTAKSLQEREVHSMIFDARYDFEDHCDSSSYFIPTLHCFYKLPFKGINTATTHSFGVVVGVNF